MNEETALFEPLQLCFDNIKSYCSFFLLLFSAIMLTSIMVILHLQTLILASGFYVVFFFSQIIQTNVVFSDFCFFFSGMKAIVRLFIIAIYLFVTSYHGS